MASDCFLIPIVNAITKPGFLFKRWSLEEDVLALIKPTQNLCNSFLLLDQIVPATARADDITSLNLALSQLVQDAFAPGKT